MSRKPRWVLSLVKVFRLEKEEVVVTHRELIDEDFPIRRVHRISEEVEVPERRRAYIEELEGLARLHGTSAMPVAPTTQTQSTTPTQPTAQLSSVNVDALSTQQTNPLQSSTKVQPVSVAETSNSDPNLHTATHERVANLIQRVEKSAAQPVGRRSENKLAAARRTVNDIPALPNHEAKGHWFNNGQTRYPGTAPRKHSGTLHRLDSILATRTDEIQALDPKYTDSGDKK